MKNFLFSLFSIISLSPSVSFAQGLSINEVLASNKNMVADPSGEYDDVVELVNLSTDTVFMLGYYLSDNASFPTKWPFPDTFILPNSYLVIWCDDQILQPGLHTNFGLSGSGESVVLTNKFLTTTDRIDYPEQSSNVSYGRWPDGTGDWRYMYPTIGYGNLSVGLSELNKNTDNQIYPNPCIDNLFIKKAVDEYQVYDADMKLIQQEKRNSITHINTENLSQGVYWLKTENGIQKFIKK